MKSTNACPENYRGLTAKQECRLRSIRLGTNETPGGVPHQNTQGPSSAVTKQAERRAAVVKALLTGPKGFHELRGFVGIDVEALSDVLGRMKADGLIKRGARYLDPWVLVLP